MAGILYNTVSPRHTRRRNSYASTTYMCRDETVYYVVCNNITYNIEYVL